MDELKASGKPFRISKQEVWDAWLKVKGNKGAPGIDGVGLATWIRTRTGYSLAGRYLPAQPGPGRRNDRTRP